MIERLEQLTMSDFISLLDGDTSVLTPDDEKVTEAEKAIAIRNILFEYREISDPVGMRSYLSETEELIKAKISRQIFAICIDLLSLGFDAYACRIFDEIGINHAKMNGNMLLAVAKSSLKKAESTISEIEKTRSAGNEIKTDVRRHFDEQTASMMSHFKFQIDPSNMKATLYAHLFARFIREIKSLSNSVRKK